MGKYKLKTVATDRIFDDSGWVLDDSQCISPSLVRTVYEKKKLEFKPISEGVYRFDDWLPITRKLKGSCAPITYKSVGLAKKLGLNNLYITFSGFSPPIGANMVTCSFKETEAYSVCGRFEEDAQSVLVVASAGNTARAFAKVCSQNKIKLLLCVPSDNLDALWFDEPVNDCVKLISCQRGGDYFDAIHLGNIAVKNPKFRPEGGAKNVARRDGMATTMLSAVEVIGEIPDFYFQAVGSGTGAIAAWEANLRLIEDGRFGGKKCKMIVSQNYPFVPMFDAWKKDSRAIELDDDYARNLVEEIDAKVLSNRRPPYGIAGGLFDALKDCDGEIVHVDNQNARLAAETFEQLEGVDIHPAAAVAVASLCEAVKNGKVMADDKVMLNITGGGERMFKTDAKELFFLKPYAVFEINPDEKEVLDTIEKLF